jgi:hypothetical protein
VETAPARPPDGRRDSPGRTGDGNDSEASRAGVRLLERGCLPAALRCAACERDFALPHAGGECFQQSIPFARGLQERDEPDLEERLFVGDEVMLAYASRDLSQELEHSVIYVGERVFAVSLGRGGSSPPPALFCADCGTNIVSRMNDKRSACYTWDRLIEFAPRKLNHRWSLLGFGLGRVAAVPDPAKAAGMAHPDSRVRAYFFARELIGDDACSRREMCIRAMRLQIPLAEAEAALAALGASYILGSEGEDVITFGAPPPLSQAPPPSWAAEGDKAMPHTRSSSELPSVAKGSARADRNGRSAPATAPSTRLWSAETDLREIWRAFCSDLRLHRMYNITPGELQALAHAAMMGEFDSKQDLLFTLRVIRGEKLGSDV